jgi:two-component sensor histidine kinase
MINFSQSLKDWNQILIKTISFVKYQQGKDLLSQNQNLLITYTPSLTSFKVMNLTKNWDFYPTAIWLPFPVINFILISRFGFRLAFEIYFLSLLASLIFLPIQKYLRPNLHKFHYKSQILSIQIVYLTYGFLLQLILLWRTSGIPAVPFPLWTYLLPLWSLVLMVLIGLVYALTGENGELQKRLLKDIEKLRSQTGESIESIRKIQKMFLNTIHGKIQGKITAATLLIENKLKDLNSEIIPAAIKEELALDLGKISEDAVKDLEMLVLWKESETDTFATMLKNLRKNWLQLIDLEIIIDDSSKQFLEDNRWLRSAFEEIISESISNAVRHSKATSMKIDSSIDLDKDELSLVISNNGKLRDEDNSGRGVGFSMFQDLGLKFELVGKDDETVLSVKIPLLQRVKSYAS